MRFVNLMSRNPLKTRKSFRLITKILFNEFFVSRNPLKTRKSFRRKL